MKRCEIDLHEVAAQAVNELMLAFPVRQITHIASGPGPCVADPDRLAQLIGNLVSNAAAYGRQGTPIIVRSENRGVDMMLSVENQGDPIPDELTAKVFEPMVRGVSGGTSARTSGSGFTSLKRSPEAMAERLELLSSREEGTRVVFRFSNSLGS
jgi:sigma-B regulation protein RsbU (phosphoserine phosphatase)